MTKFWCCGREYNNQQEEYTFWPESQALDTESVALFPPAMLSIPVSFNVCPTTSLLHPTYRARPWSWSTLKLATSVTEPDRGVRHPVFQ